MALLIEKVAPRELNEFSVNSDVASTISRMCAHPDNFPHILFYGPSGAGKRTLALALVNALYGAGTSDRVKVESRQIRPNTGGGTAGTPIDVKILLSTHHMEVVASDSGSKDSAVVMHLIKEMAQSSSLNAATAQASGGSSVGFKTIVISDADLLSAGAQAGLRRTLEKYSAACRVVLVAESLSRIIPPIRSRCLCIRVPSPSQDSILQVLKKAEVSESIRVKDGSMETIAASCNGDLRNALMLMECNRVITLRESILDDGSQKRIVSAAPWEEIVRSIATLITEDQSPRALLEIRAKLYDILCSCVPGDCLLSSMTIAVIRATPGKNSFHRDVVAFAAEFSHRMKLGTKDIVHLEAFVSATMAALKSGNSSLISATLAGG